jgi:hypothetical protein
VQQARLEAHHRAELGVAQLLRAIASKTGWASAGELEMTRRISPVAVC